MSTPERSREAGFTLIEVLVAASLFTLVVLCAGGILMGLFSAQRQVSAITSTTTDAQLAATSIDTGVHNSSWFKAEVVGADEILRARVAGGDASTIQWRCVAWYWSAAAAELRTTSSTGARVANPTPEQFETWTLLADGVTAVDGSTIFVDHGDSLAVAFEVATTDDDKPVAIAFTATPPADLTESAPCS